jgi:hypothetical protein
VLSIIDPDRDDLAGPNWRDQIELRQLVARPVSPTHDLPSRRSRVEAVVVGWSGVDHDVVAVESAKSNPSCFLEHNGTRR